MILHLASVLALFAVVTAQCPDPYTPLDETRCILIDPYVTYTFDEAKAYCKTHGGAMLTVSDCETVGLLYDFIRFEAGTQQGHHYWLGATDQAEEGTWKFVNNQPVPMGTPFWAPGEPNGADVENCAILHNSNNHQWADIDCARAFNVMCLRNL